MRLQAPARNTYDEYLVGPDWLVEHVDDHDVRIVDCRFTGTAATSREAYANGHIPTAIHSYWLDELCEDDTRVTTLLPPTAKAEDSLGRLGISADTDVIAYADSASLYATRLWQLLRHHGHRRVRLLDGGLEAWVAAGLPLEAGAATAQPVTFRSRPAPSTVITTEELRQRLDDPSLHILDCRTPEEYVGVTVRAARGGHIPGATLLPFTDLIDHTGRYRKISELEARFLAAGVDRSGEVVTYCQGGIRAAHAALALALTGRRAVLIYDGSWAQWGNDPTLPIVVPIPAGAGA